MFSDDTVHVSPVTKVGIIVCLVNDNLDQLVHAQSNSEPHNVPRNEVCRCILVGTDNVTKSTDITADMVSAVISLCISTRNFRTQRIGKQRRLRRACAYAQTRHSLRYSHTQNMDVNKCPDLNLDL